MFLLLVLWEVSATSPKPGINMAEHDAIPARFDATARISLE
jgi:hypothetical protein